MSARIAANRARRADEICAAALAIVAQDGLHGLTMQRLAKVLGKAVGAVYRDFPSKDALLTELQIRTIAAYCIDRDALLTRADSAGLGGPARLAAVAGHFRRWFGDRPGHFGLITTAMATPQRLLPDAEATRVMRAVIPALQPVAALIEDLAQRQELTAGDSRERTLVFWGALQGVVQLAKVGRLAPDPFDIDRLLTSAVRALLVGWGVTDDAAVDREIQRGQELVT